MKVVIALGGNALGNTPESQKEIVRQTAKYILPIIQAGYEVVLTHGNGPQVGLINLAFEEGKRVNQKVCEMPFSECGAMSQGYIGYHLQNALQNELEKNNIDKKVISIITQVEVDSGDKAFSNPTKPIGSFYSEQDAIILKETMHYVMKEDAGRGYRRVIASPKPKKIIEEDIIKSLIDNKYIVITCGGGGIPVIKGESGYIGVDAVIDKDYASAKLADEINSDILMILTAVENVCINYNTPEEKRIYDTNIEEMELLNSQGHFYAGSMKPKVEAGLEFVKKGNNRIAIITSIDKAIQALEGKAGTRIVS